MKSVLCFLVVAFSCQSLLCEEVSSYAEYVKPTGGVFVQGELPKRDISKDIIRTHASSKVNTTRVRIEEVTLETATPEPEPLPEAETEPHDEDEAQFQDEHETQTPSKTEDEDEPKIEPVTDTDFLPCSFIPCPLNKKPKKNIEFKPVNNPNPKPKAGESMDDVSEEYRLSLEFYHSLSFQLLLISLFCLTMVLLLTAVLVAMYLTKNGLGLKRFKKLENRDCGLNKYNF